MESLSPHFEHAHHTNIQRKSGSYLQRLTQSGSAEYETKEKPRPVFIQICPFHLQIHSSPCDSCWGRLIGWSGTELEEEQEAESMVAGGVLGGAYGLEPCFCAELLRLKHTAAFIALHNPHRLF